ncbi:MAG TPA: ATP-binding protein [Terriglobales bacterium]|nr:ATP-binding protein [Terriglobales bacterium]
MTAPPPSARDGSFRLLFASNPLPMWVYDLATSYVLEVNDAAIAYYGYRRDEFLRLRVTDLTPADERARVKDTLAEVAAARDQAVRRYDRTWKQRRKDGTVRDVDAASHALEFGGRQARLVVVNDVTDLKRTQDALARSTERLEILHEIDRALLAAASPGAIAEVALARLRDLLGVPRAIVNLFHFETAEAEWLAAAGRRRIHVGPGVRFSLALMGDLAALRRGEPQTIQTAALPRSEAADALLAAGVEHYMVMPMIAGGELLGGLSFGGPQAEFPAEQVAIAGEVATQLAVAVAQARLHERVTRQAQRLELLHEIDRSIIAAETPAAMAAAVLPRLRDLLGVPRAVVSVFDLDAGTVDWLAAAGRRRVRVGPGVRHSIRFAGNLDALRRGELQTIDVRTIPPGPDADALRASGVHWYVVVPMIAGGELIGALSFGAPSPAFSTEHVGIAREVAAQLAIALAQARLRERVQRQADELERRVEARTLELSAAKAEADRANRAKSEFLSRMSHELRTPLNGILGFAQLLEMDAQAPEQRESVGHILRGGRHLLRLIDEVLDLARIEAGRLAISLEPVLVSEVVRGALDLVRPLATPRRIALDDETAAPDRYVVADRQRLQQVLLNLLSNAIKYNRDAGRVRVACASAADGRTTLTVHDTGPGIAPELQARLFTPFDRLGAEQSGVPGTGLGLALSKRLLEAMDGRLTVESAPRRGTTFAVALTTASAPAPAHEANGAGGAGRDGAPPPTRGTVLYVEDNAANLRLFERVVARRPGVELLTAMQGRRGLELARAHRPALIVLDLHLPDVPGETVLAGLRDDPATASIPVVILSADVTPGHVGRLRAQGAHSYLTKPLDVVELLSLLDSLLNEPER